jgi:hypothetical protein
MDKYPPHNEKYFYKYLSIDTAKLILMNKKFRYSSPLIFNDPFDGQTEVTFDFEIANFNDDIVNEMIRLASFENDFLYKEYSDMIKSIELLKKIIKKEGTVDPILKNGLIEINKEISRALEETRLQYNVMWQDFLKALRVFSLSINFNSILMWSHYANNHTGVVFKLKALHEEDNLICVAQPVIYQNKPPKFFSKKEWIDDILGIKKLDFVKLYKTYPIIKYDLWNYEDEWRVLNFEWDHKNQLFTDYKLFPNELVAIYFGCNTEKDDIDEITKLSLNINPQIYFFRAKRVVGEYKLQFDEI